MKKKWQNIAFTLCIAPIILFFISVFIMPKYSRFFLVSEPVCIGIAHIISRTKIKDEKDE